MHCHSSAVRTGRLVRTAAVLALVAALAPSRDAHAAAATLPTDFTDTVIASALDTPTGIAEVPDPANITPRRVLFVEQITGRVRLAVGATVTTVGTVPNVTTGSERGLLGVVVDPGWPARPYLYVHNTDGRSSPATISISRFTLTGDLAGTGNGALVFDPATRYDLRRDFPDNASNHNGGTVRFGPDGKLYVSLGDDGTGCPALDITVAVGKIMRMDVSQLPPTGTGPAPYALIAPADNPFAANADSVARLVWTYGLRNPFRFNVDPQGGDLVIGDVGQNAWEEVDLATAGGMNMGWPVWEGPAAYTTCPQTPPAAPTAPIAYYDHPTGYAIIGGPRYRRPATGALRFPPEYDGDVFFLDYYSGLMRRVKLTAGTWTPASAPGQPTATEWGTGLNNVSDIIECSDGSLLYCRQTTGTSLTGEIRRIAYTGSTGVPPLPPPGLVLEAPHPNPSRGDVTISWTQAVDGPAVVSIFTADGHRVRRVLDGAGTSGPHTFVWDGRDDGGRRLHGGVYFARLEAGGQSGMKRFALLR